MSKVRYILSDKGYT